MSMEMDDDVGRLLKTMLLKKSQLKGLKGSIGDVNVAGASGDGMRVRGHCRCPACGRVHARGHI